MFIGRKKELKRLKDFAKRKSAGLAVCSGRRRIGKSTLIEHFGQSYRFLEFYGLAPRDGITAQRQLDHFGELMGLPFNLPPIPFDNWNSALSTLATLTEEGKWVILLDEISWMASRDKDFVGKLKGIWDTKFKKNPELILILCGSVSAWIEDNILNDKGFMGRISLTLHLEELPLPDVNLFWRNHSLVSAHEKFKLLCVTGGVPRYLEEINVHETAEQNLKRMCFSPGGILFEEFEKIFRDIFENRADDYTAIVQALSGPALELGELCKRLGVSPTGGLTKKLRTLVQSGFVARDYVWSGSKKHPKLSKYRLRDNYLRFYLRYLEPKRELIQTGALQDLHLEDLPNWPTVIGLQFENLVLNNMNIILHRLDISPANLLSAAPYYQNDTARHKSCQIDLLIQTRHTVYVCEIKFRSKIEGKVIDEVGEKIDRLRIPKGVSVRPVLIYQGELSRTIQESGYFSHLISFEGLLEN